MIQLINLRDEIHVKSGDKWEVVDIIDFKCRKIMTTDGHVFDLDTAEVANSF